MSSFKQFRDGQLRHDTSLGEEDEQSLRDVLDNLHNSEDLTNLLELRDVEDELSTIDRLFSDQD